MNSQISSHYGGMLSNQQFNGAGYQVRNGALQSQVAMRRNLISQILNNGPGITSYPQQMDQMKRKKLRDLIFGSK